MTIAMQRLFAVAVLALGAMVIIKTEYLDAAIRPVFGLIGCE